VSILPDHPVADPFYWKGVTIQQDERVLKVGTDSILLANWVSHLFDAPQHILDAGTGSGVLALVIAQAYPQASVMAIDPDEHAFQLATHNVRESPDRNRIQVKQQDLLEYAESSDQRFDLIISNPPFYTNHILPSSGVMQSAKHATLSPGQWMSSLNRLLHHKGSICLVLPTSMTFHWTREANILQLYVQTRMEIFSFPGELQSKRSLVCFGHQLGKPVHEKMIMYTSDKVYTAEYASWLGV
jgi:tRNA1Val (adenine37-N6)-methyltransferase